MFRDKVSFLIFIRKTCKVIRGRFITIIQNSFDLWLAKISGPAEKKSNESNSPSWGRSSDSAPSNHTARQSWSSWRCSAWGGSSGRSATNWWSTCPIYKRILACLARCRVNLLQIVLDERFLVPFSRLAQIVNLLLLVLSIGLHKFEEVMIATSLSHNQTSSINFNENLLSSEKIVAITDPLNWQSALKFGQILTN